MLLRIFNSDPRIFNSDPTKLYVTDRTHTNPLSRGTNSDLRFLDIKDRTPIFPYGAQLCIALSKHLPTTEGCGATNNRLRWPSFPRKYSKRYEVQRGRKRTPSALRAQNARRKNCSHWKNLGPQCKNLGPLFWFFIMRALSSRYHFRCMVKINR
jgi:hypothetical protein